MNSSFKKKDKRTKQLNMIEVSIKTKAKVKLNRLMTRCNQKKSSMTSFKLMTMMTNT